MTEQAIEQFERWDHPGGLGLAYAAAGRSAEAREIHKTLAELQGTPTEDIQNLIGIPAALGDKETALDWLERAYEERDGLLVYLKIWPPFDPLRSEPRFEAVLKRVGLGE